MNKTTRDIPERIWIGPKTIAMLGLADNKQAKNAHEYVCADHIAALERQVAEAQAAIDKLVKAAEISRAALEWIDAIPADTAASLPGMPGFDRDDAEEVLEAAQAAAKENSDER